MPLPQFLVIGAAKCGTTSLHRYLDQHPDIFMAKWGEPSFFAHEGAPPTASGPGDDEWHFVTDLATYEGLFLDAEPGQLLGEVSPRYLFFPESADRIQQRVPDAKLVAILRQPVDRAYSHFLMNRSRGCEPEADFSAAILKEAEREKLGWGWDWSYLSAGLYAQQLSAYYDRFPPEQLRVYVYDDLQNDRQRFFADLFSFLGVDPTFQPDVSRRERVAAVPKTYALSHVLRRSEPLLSFARRAVPSGIRGRVASAIRTWNSAPPPALSEYERQELTGRYFEEDIEALERLLGRKLDGWR